MKDEQERFRMTVWPGVLPNVRELEGFGPYHLDGDLLKLDFDAQMFTHQIPDELYLRDLYELDLDSNEEILGFINSYGRLGHPWSRADREDDEHQTRLDSQLFRLLGVEVPKDSDLPWSTWFSEIDADGTPLELPAFERVIFESEGLQHIDTFKGWVRAFKRLTRLHQKSQSGHATFEELTNLSMILTDLLRPIHPAMRVQYPGDPSPYPSFTEEQYPPLETALAIQIFNHVASGSVYHTCANETHDGLFVHQQGRAEAGQHRSVGVKYCSMACAKAQASREYRRRKIQRSQREQ